MGSPVENLKPVLGYPRVERDFPAALLRELAVTNYRISVIFDAFGYCFFGSIAYVYVVHLRVGGPPANHWLSTVLPYYPVLLTLLMAVCTLLLLKPLTTACRLLNLNYYMAPIIAVSSIVLGPSIIGYVVLKCFQFQIRQRFAAWNLPCAWIHNPPRKVISLVNAKERQLKNEV